MTLQFTAKEYMTAIPDQREDVLADGMKLLATEELRAAGYIGKWAGAGVAKGEIAEHTQEILDAITSEPMTNFDIAEKVGGVSTRKVATSCYHLRSLGLIESEERNFPRGRRLRVYWREDLD